MTLADDDTLAQLIASAQRVGIELDEADMAEWITAISTPADDDLVVDLDSGTFGHRVSMLDFSPRELARFRRIGEVVQVTGPAGIVEGALALSGSAAQSKIQSFPGDCDYFQRLNIKADTRAEASAILAQVFREKVLSAARGSWYQFLEAKLGSYPVDARHRGVARSKGGPITWSLEEVEAGRLELEVEGEATPRVVTWEEAAADPGWCKLDWVVSDPERRQLSNASNVVDVTWEAPDGSIVALDGYLDAYFQEVYLDAEELPVFTKLAAHVTDDALDEYVATLEHEVHKYLTSSLNYGKAAKRMYNVFRLSGRHLDAAFVRELFDEPATILYQVWSLITTLDNATVPGSSIPIGEVQAQADELILGVVRELDGEEEQVIVRALLELRQTLNDQDAGERRTAQVEASRAHVVNLINNFFRDKLLAVPTIREYIAQMQADASA